MSNEYKQCPNGHYYRGAQCPYCKPGNTSTVGGYAGSGTSLKTEIYGTDDSQAPTETWSSFGPDSTTLGPESPAKTTIFDDTYVTNPGKPITSTEFGDEDSDFTNGNPNGHQGGGRTARKLVGWLVSYTLDSLGVDFKLFEGRNIIGRNAECNISVNDKMVSGEHAVILYRAGKYSITDRQSSHGTFVNDTDIELEPCYLQDGDVIRVGKTQFKFRTSF